jgi:hypothetical protein
VTHNPHTQNKNSNRAVHPATITPSVSAICLVLSPHAFGVYTNISFLSNPLGCRDCHRSELLLLLLIVFVI